jgi:hypothetical protein
VLKTTSGKPRRQQMRRLYLEGALAHRTFDPAEATASVEPAVAAR